VTAELQKRYGGYSFPATETGHRDGWDRPQHPLTLELYGMPGAIAKDPAPFASASEEHKD